MRTIFKYEIPLQAQARIEIPPDPWFLRVGLQGQRIMLWAVVDPDETPVERTFMVIGTGTIDPTGNEYLGTVIMGAFTWHVFVEPA